MWVRFLRGSEQNWNRDTYPQAFSGVFILNVKSLLFSGRFHSKGSKVISVDGISQLFSWTWGCSRARAWNLFSSLESFKKIIKIALALCNKVTLLACLLKVSRTKSPEEINREETPETIHPRAGRAAFQLHFRVTWKFLQCCPHAYSVNKKVKSEEHVHVFRYVSQGNIHYGNDYVRHFSALSYLYKQNLNFGTKFWHNIARGNLYIAY